MGFTLLLGLLESVFAIVHNSANRRFGIRGDFHQIQFGILGHPPGVRQGNNPRLLAVLIDQAHFAPGDLFVEPEFIIRSDVAVLQ